MVDETAGNSLSKFIFYQSAEEEEKKSKRFDKIENKYSLQDLLPKTKKKVTIWKELFEYDQRDIERTAEELQKRQATLLKLKEKNKQVAQKKK